MHAKKYNILKDKFNFKELKEKMNKLIILTVIAVVTSSALAETCQKPEVSASAYVTEDATILTNIAFTTQFTLKCSNGAKGVSLYAEVEGKTLPAVRLSADNKYQVNLTLLFFFLIFFNQLVIELFFTSISSILSQLFFYINFMWF